MLQLSSNPCRRRSARLRGMFALLALALALGGCRSLSASESERPSASLLDQVPAPSFAPAPPKRVLEEQDQAYAEAALTHWLEVYLNRKYEVVDRRFFWAPQGSSQWAALGTTIGLRVRTIFGGRTTVDIPWQSPGIDLAEVWEVEYQGTTRIFAMAMTDEPVPGTRGRRLMGYFELKRLQ
jgi:hypothetical protein